jgi:outer membrane receptor protein involved in Fe transport
MDSYRASLSSRYIHSVTENPGDAGDPALPGFVETRKVEAVLYHDVQVSYTYKPAKVELALGVDNVTDELAPTIFSGFNGSTDVRTYDVVGRAYYSRVKLSF